MELANRGSSDQLVDGGPVPIEKRSRFRTSEEVMSEVAKLMPDQKLSGPQKAAVLGAFSVVYGDIVEDQRSIRDRMFSLMETQQKVAGLIEAARVVLRRPLFSERAPTRQPRAGGSGIEEVFTHRGFKKWATWGNLAGVGGLILVAIAGFYTRAYTSYKDRCDNQAEVIKEQKEEIQHQRDRTKELSDDNMRLAGEAGEAKALRERCAQDDKQIDALGKRAAELSGKASLDANTVKAIAELDSLRKSTGELGQAKTKAETELAERNKEVERMKKEEEEQKKQQKLLEDRLERLNGENNRLQEQLRTTKTH